MGGQDTRRCTPHEISSIRVPAPDDFDDAGDESTIIVASPAKPRLEIGRLIEGRLRITRLLGRGGMSEVYEAYDERARRTVAIKLMLTEQCADAQLAIFAEARALLGFSHPHVLGFYGVGAIEAQPFIEIETAAGGSLAEQVERDGALPIAHALDVMIKIADGLAALHRAGTVHRDVKADNVLLTEDGRPVVADFGLAMYAETLPALPNGIVGTPAYMAPEAILGVTETFEQYAWADQYSLGVTLYFALTGTMPFSAETPSGLFYAQMALEPESPSARRPGIPPALDAIVRRALEKRPQDRFASVAAMRDALVEARDALGLVPTPGDTSSGRAPVPRAASGAPALKHTVVAA